MAATAEARRGTGRTGGAEFPTDDPEAAIECLAESIAEQRAILFAGAGLSISLGLPSWRELIRRMCAELEVDSRRIVGPDSYRVLAEYYRIRRGEVGSLRRWMDQTWTQSRDRAMHWHVHDIIVELDFPSSTPPTMTAT